MHYDWGMWHDGWWMWLGMLAFWSTVIFLVIWGVRSLTSDDRRDGPYSLPREESAIEIARKRYARGEISREEYQDILTGLTET